MLINRSPKNDITTTLDIQNIALAGQAKLYRYSAATPNAITSAPLILSKTSRASSPPLDLAARF